MKNVNDKQGHEQDDVKYFLEKHKIDISDNYPFFMCVPGFRADYYYKKVNKYPSRIYIFMEAEIWQPRNRRPMALQNSIPFFTREMTMDERIDVSSSCRLLYWQYENWDDLIAADISVGVSKKDIDSILKFKNKFKLGETK